jgi:hypothetical protein
LEAADIAKWKAQFDSDASNPPTAATAKKTANAAATSNGDSSATTNKQKKAQKKPPPKKSPSAKTAAEGEKVMSVNGNVATDGRHLQQLAELERKFETASK